MFTVAEEVVGKAACKIEELGYEASSTLDCAKVSVVGGGINGVPGVMANFIQALSKYEIAILQTVDSHTSISVLVKNADVQKAVTSLHETFNLAE
jgi:aspartate kinase